MRESGLLYENRSSIDTSLTISSAGSQSQGHQVVVAVLSVYLKLYPGATTSSAKSLPSSINQRCTRFLNT